MTGSDSADNSADNLKLVPSPRFCTRLQATKAGHGGLGTRLPRVHSDNLYQFEFQYSPPTVVT